MCYSLWNLFWYNAGTMDWYFCPFCVLCARRLMCDLRSVPVRRHGRHEEPLQSAVTAGWLGAGQSFVPGLHRRNGRSSGHLSIHRWGRSQHLGGDGEPVVGSGIRFREFHCARYGMTEMRSDTARQTKRVFQSRSESFKPVRGDAASGVVYWAVLDNVRNVPVFDPRTGEAL